MHTTGLRHIALLLPDLRLGGGQRVLLALAEQWARQGHRVDLITVIGDGELIPEVPHGVRHVALVHPAWARKKSLFPRALWSWWRYLRRHRPDAALSSMTGTNLLALCARWLTQQPARLVAREAASFDNLRHPRMRRWMRRLYPRADCVVAVSRGVAEDLSDLGLPAPRIQVIHNPVDPASLRQRARTPLSAALTDAPYLISVGRLTEQKDHATLLRAYARSAARVTHRLAIVGDGDLKPALTALADSLGIAHRVLWLGALTDPYAALSGAALFVLSSRWEGHPNVLLEALALGVPVVACDCPSGPAEILRGGQYGSLVPVGDADALAAAIDARLLAPHQAIAPEALAAHAPQEVAARYLRALLGTD